MDLQTLKSMLLQVRYAPSTESLYYYTGYATCYAQFDDAAVFVRVNQLIFNAQAYRKMELEQTKDMRTLLQWAA